MPLIIMKLINNNKFLKTCYFLIIFIIIIVLMGGSEVSAQGTIEWSSPLELSGSASYSNSPAIVVDPYGVVHVFWAEDVGGQPASRLGRTSGSANTIMYRLWDGQRWTSNVDIFSYRNGLVGLAAIIDQNDIIHLAWREWDGLHYSYAPADAASKVRAWRQDEVIAWATGFAPTLAVDDENVLHVVYSQNINTTNQTKDGNLYYIQSADSGKNWSFPIQISDIDINRETLVDTPDLAVDALGYLHLVWYTIDPPDWTGTKVFYSKSVDNGQTWSEPWLLDQVDETSIWASKPKIAVRYPQEVHIIWVCGLRAYRCHQWSVDGGETWSTVRHQVFGEMHSLAYWDAMAVDRANTLYWVVQLRYPEALYYTYWTGSQWVSPPLLLSNHPQVAQAHGPELTIRNGNELHLVAVNPPYLDSIWHLWGMTGVDPFPPQPTPTLSTTPKPSPVVLIPSTVLSGNLVDDRFYIDQSESPASEVNNRSMVAGVVPVLILLTIIIFVIINRRL